MKAYFLIVGTLCILYYVMLAVYSRRLSSTFAGFWLMAGGAHLIIGCVPFPLYVYRILGWAVAAMWMFFLLVEFRILFAAWSRKREKADCILILGAQVRGVRITNSLKRRLDAALQYLREHPGTRVVVSGGQGSGEEIPEAQAMEEYLISRGVEKERITREDRSTSTRENFRYSKKYLDADREKVGIVTNDFHLYRASIIARKEGYHNICLIPASSNPVFQLNYLVREFFGILALCFPGRK